MNKIKFNTKKQVLIILFSIMIAYFAFSAEGTIAILDKWGENILGILKSSWLQAIAAIALVIQVGGAWFASQNGSNDLAKKILGWSMINIIVMSAKPITEFFWNQN